MYHKLPDIRPFDEIIGVYQMLPLLRTYILKLPLDYVETALLTLQTSLWAICLRLCSNPLSPKPEPERMSAQNKTKNVSNPETISIPFAWRKTVSHYDIQSQGSLHFLDRP
jgi:hypothetical protein